MKQKFGKWTSAASPYRLRRKDDAGGWVISYGVSGFLVAEGSGWSQEIGSMMVTILDNAYHKRRAKRRKMVAE